MRKRMMTLAAVAVLAITLTACGAAQTSNNPAPTVEPTKEAEATTAPTVEPTKEAEVTTAPTVEPTATNVPEPTATSTPTPEPTATPVPTSTPTPEPTATPEPTSTPTPEPTATPEPTSTPTPEPTATPVPTSTPTPEPTATPVPTEAPKADTKDWKTVLRELHSLETYAEREAYVAKLDKSVYKVEKTENFDLINKHNYGEVETSNGQKKTTGYKLISESTFETVAEYTVDTLPEEYLDAVAFGNGVEHADYGYCFFEEVYTYETKTVNAKAALDVFVQTYCDTMGNYDEKLAPAYLMTLTNIATGETDPWCVVSDETTYNWEVDAQVSQVYTIEDIVTSYNRCVDKLADDDWASEQVLYEYVEENGPVHNIETWDTFKYYEDLVSLTTTFVVEEW